MRTATRFLVLLLLTGCTSVRVLVFNIHAGRDAAGQDNLARVAALVQSTKADIVLLQEVDRNTARSGNVDQLVTLMRLTGFHGAFGKSLDYQGGEYGIATLSRWPISAHETVHLPVEPVQVRAGGSVEPRVALIVETNSMRVINTHLDASREERYRLQEVEHLLPLIERQRGSPVLAGGDFNSVPDSAVQQRLRAARLNDSWTECGRGQQLTYPADVPVKRIDYLFLVAGVRCRSAAVLESKASDHRPVIVTVRIADGP